MSKLAALKKQIAALEAQAERIAKAEMSSAIAKIKDIMSEFNVTIEHLSQAASDKRAAKSTVKKASVAKYADPKTGKTWSGFGRAPGWIAGAKNRDAFLVSKSTAAAPAAKAPAAAKKLATKAAKPASKKASTRKVAKPVAKKAVAAAKKAARAGSASAPKAAKKKPLAGKAVSKAAARKAAKKRAPIKAAGVTTAADGAAASAT
jgi:DNA-binding protein H-NS